VFENRFLDHLEEKKTGGMLVLDSLPSWTTRKVNGR
jgi:hypothetical protein